MRQLLALLLLMPFAFAGDYYALVPIAGTLAALIVGLTYALSQLFQHPQIEGWSKAEWRELIIAGITVGLVYSAVSTSQGQILGLATGYSASSLVSDVESKFDAMEASLTSDYQTAIELGHRLSMIASYSYTKGGGYIFYIGVSNSPYAGVGGGLLQNVSLIAASLSTGILIYHAMVLFLKFFFITSVNYVLPLGLAARLIPFTRSIGGTLIGLSLAGIFVYPMSMALVAEIHDNIGLEHSLISDDELEDLKLNLPSALVDLCQNEWIRTATSMSEWGWWFFICTPFCAIFCLFCVGPQYAACYPPCFMECWMPISGLCWWYTYNFYNYFQLAFMVASSTLLVAASENIEDAFSGDIGNMYDLVMKDFVAPVSGASTVPIMEAVLVGGLTIVGARALSSAVAGEMHIIGLERLL